MARRATAKQVEALTLVEAGGVKSLPAATLRPLMNRGWVVPGAWDVLQLTSEGVEELEWARLLAEFEALPFEVRSRVRVERRKLGGRTYGRGSAYPDGRNVDCSDCYWSKRKRRALGERHFEVTPIVWYTNEGGAPAQRDAEEARVRHVVAHARGEFPYCTREDVEALEASRG